MERLTNVVFLVLGLVFGIALSTLFNGCGDAGKTKWKEKAEKPLILKEEAEQTALLYASKLDSVSAHNTVLQEQVNSTKTALSVAKRKNSQLTQRVNELIAVNEVLNDTTELLANCDTLEQAVQELIVSCNEKDSLYDNVIASMQKQISNRDSTIGLQQQQYLFLKLSFDRSIEQQTSLFSENKSYQKQFKWQKAKSRLLSAGMLVLAGVATYSLIHH